MIRRVIVSLYAVLGVQPTGIFAHVPQRPRPHLDGTAVTQSVQTGQGSQNYKSVPNWCKLPEGLKKLGNTHGNIVIDAKGRVYFNTDTQRSIMVYSPDGEYLYSFGQDHVGIHDMVLRSETGGEFIYAAHLGGHQVVKFTLDGTVVWTLPWPQQSGKYKNEGQYHPTGVAVAPNGDIYVADGYGQNWIHQYTAERQYVRSFGGPGEQPGKFRTCHGLQVDVRTDSPTLVICDRENRRLQRFNLEGKFLKVLANDLRRPCHIAFHGDRTVVAELEARVTILGKSFEPLAHLGDNPDRNQWAQNPVGPEKWQEGIFIAPHGACFDAAGNLYVMDWNRSGRISKLIWRRPKDQSAN